MPWRRRAAFMINNHRITPCHFEHVPIALYPNYQDASRDVAAEVAALVRARQLEGRSAVLGLATGSTPVAFYAELVRLHREEGLSFANVVTFNLDEYYGLPSDHEGSYRRFMHTHLFDHVDLPPGQINLPLGALDPGEIDVHCAVYEEKIRAAGGIDLQILGIGRTGHIAFNEPGSPRYSRTRLVTLDSVTRDDAANDFGGIEYTPRHALTMGVRAIMSARRIVLMAWGQHKATIVRAAVEGEVTHQITASFLQEHDNVVFVLDRAAAGSLTRHRTPWRLGSLEGQGLAWDERMTRCAILWLSELCKKPILKLTDENYNAAGLQDLIQKHGSAYECNLVGFYQIQHTITGWPGGRDPARFKSSDLRVRPLQSDSATVFPKRILVLSPQPDDAVIAMGGTLCRLVDQAHEVHVAYAVCGASGVSDETVWRALMFATACGIADTDAAARLAATRDEISQGVTIATASEVLGWKALIRRHEAISSARECGIPNQRLHFLDLPFYHAPARGRAYGKVDVGIVRTLLEQIRPHLIYAAGDLNDSQGTNRLCLRILRDVLAHNAKSGNAWLDETELWLYRGAQAEWPLDEIDMAVPLSPQEMLRRRRAIFHHEVQKDQALSISEERSEFWLPAEDGNRRLAEAYNRLGLAEYEAIEAFKRHRIRDFANDTSL